MRGIAVGFRAIPQHLDQRQHHRLIERILVRGVEECRVGVEVDTTLQQRRVVTARYAEPAGADEIGRAHVSTPVTNAQPVCRLLLEKQNWYNPMLNYNQYSTARKTTSDS